MQEHFLICIRSFTDSLYREIPLSLSWRCRARIRAAGVTLWKHSPYGQENGCAVFRLKDGKIQSFNCYPSGTVIMGQLGVLQNREVVLPRTPRHYRQQL